MGFSVVNGFRDLSFSLPVDYVPYILYLLEKGALIVDEKRFAQVMKELESNHAPDSCLSGCNALYECFKAQNQEQPQK